jgi:methionyl aminopeptidase
VSTGELDRIGHDYQVNAASSRRRLTIRRLGTAWYPRRCAHRSITSSATASPATRNSRPATRQHRRDGHQGRLPRRFEPDVTGAPIIQARRLVEVTYEGCGEGLRYRPGARLGDIGATIQASPRTWLLIVREFCGHGIGRQFHEEPQVLHYGRPGTGLRLEPGMIFTIEPMINAGRPGIRCLADGWTIVTADHSLSAQWEHTVLVTPTGFEVMTVSAGAPAPPPLPPPVTQAA